MKFNMVNIESLITFLNENIETGNNVVIRFMNVSIVVTYALEFKNKDIPKLIKNFEERALTYDDVDNGIFADISVIDFFTTDDYIKEVEKQNNMIFKEKVNMKNKMLEV